MHAVSRLAAGLSFSFMHLFLLMGAPPDADIPRAFSAKIRYKTIHNFIVNSRFASLRCLEAARYMIHSATLDKIGTRLMKLKRDASVHTLATNIQNPFVIKWPHVYARFARASHFADTAIKILFEINWTKHGAEDNRFVLNRKLREDRQPEIRPILVFAGAAYDNIIIAVSPVSRHTFRKAFNALREKVKHAITAAFYHSPAFITPFVCVLQQKIRGKASHDDGTRRDLQRSVTFLFYRQIEVQCFSALFRRNRTAVCFILPINIAVTASFGVFRTAVPWIPTCVFLFTHLSVPTNNALNMPSCKAGSFHSS